MIQPQLAAAAIDRGENAGEMQVSAAQIEISSNDNVSACFVATALGSLAALLAVTLSGCSDKPAPQAAAAAPPVTVAQPVKRTVTDWDEFTGRFEAVEEVQVTRAGRRLLSPMSSSRTATWFMPATCFI